MLLKTYLLRERTMVSLGNVFAHSLSHRLDFFTQRDTRCWWEFNAISQIPVSSFDLIYKHREVKRMEISKSD